MGSKVGPISLLELTDKVYDLVIPTFVALSPHQLLLGTFISLTFL